MYSSACNQELLRRPATALTPDGEFSFEATTLLIGIPSKLRVLEMPMKKLFNVTNVVATAGFLFASYILISSLPDVRRYIRISTM
jgi:Family of unknown function (DUF6893)